MFSIRGRGSGLWERGVEQGCGSEGWNRGVGVRGGTGVWENSENLRDSSKLLLTTRTLDLKSECRQAKTTCVETTAPPFN
jgi:hypothetical protein